MCKKLTIDFVRDQIEREGYVLLSESYINAHKKLDFICPNGHKWSTLWNSWQQGCRCLECSGSKKLTIEFVTEQFYNEGYILLDKKYINAHQKLRFICPKGHIGSIMWLNWEKGKRCAKCSGNVRLTLDFVKNYFQKEGYILLSKKYVNSQQKLDFICSKGHVGKISWNSWKAGRRCKECYLLNNKGVKHPNWNPSLTDIDRIGRRLIPDYTEWNYAVKERDNFTCQICGDCKGGNLISHHLESYNSNHKLRTALNNGVCLCEKCHKNFHHNYGFGDNTKEQFEEFKASMVSKVSELI